ncbi:MAG: hypothetical protein WBA13_23475 [Microcoleaceae cyanobacterium]
MKSKKNRKKQQDVPWFEKIMALLAAINFILVLFNFTYTRWRDLYIQYLPSLTEIYDPIKGIEPHRDTQKYLNTVNRLKQQVVQTGLNSEESIQILNSLQTQSTDMINTNPFAIANKSGTLETIKNRMRDRITIAEDSAQVAFEVFWSPTYLNTQELNSEIDWFEDEIAPLIAQNYYRSLGENGEYISYFWRIDLPFMIVFLIEYIARTYWISRRFITFNFKDAMLWRWYDVFLFLPFWRWLRAIPVSIRLNQNELIDLERVRNQAIRIVLTNFAQELTEIVIVQAINQLQNAIQSGELSQQILEDSQRKYIDLNNINEIEAIATHLVQATVYHVIPKLQPNLEELLQYSLEAALKESSLYKQFKNLPGWQNISHQMTQQLVHQLSQLATDSPQKMYEAVKQAIEDPVGTQLSNRLVNQFTHLLGEELQQEQSLQEIESLLVAFLEEFKINYVQKVDVDHYQQVVTETQQLRRITKGASQS